MVWLSRPVTSSDRPDEHSIIFIDIEEGDDWGMRPVPQKYPPKGPCLLTRDPAPCEDTPLIPVDTDPSVVQYHVPLFFHSSFLIFSKISRLECKWGLAFGSLDLITRETTIKCESVTIVMLERSPQTNFSDSVRADMRLLFEKSFFMLIPEYSVIQDLHEKSVLSNTYPSSAAKVICCSKLRRWYLPYTHQCDRSFLTRDLCNISYLQRTKWMSSQYRVVPL